LILLVTVFVAAFFAASFSFFLEEFFKALDNASLVVIPLALFLKNVFDFCATINGILVPASTNLSAPIASIFAVLGIIDGINPIPA